ncbi:MULTISPECIES: translocation/assembly module TamB domain-containing protein [Sulfitobacter]|uniref:translocation/assembly module TamB domain-containing protein n=1 Tax=Sulfitobacter TaxID=60136 RepID=UPI0023074FBE|nr:MULTISPECIES: translocation/assembly module TamB domain-containing protein [Sulfitobacter]MDF3382988.1 translocation/assembly module TamB [Sulfitobacter sp. Ks11]MDF3386407.1 translocation/assembly module TamB [Sulfitobacter sp. M85]MDF3389826.1 translocation/assembly module TamB [Sulfitobacter sp. Ks16]MDF3400463.1 translocation/assembly module TamB [Sulfitobacter sp. KE39]MDF3403884.1 translocation/assembly module TamB [Sulfitobacter sp. Ks35]
MRQFLQILTASLVYLACLTAAAAQDDDKGFLTRTIQDALSGAGRTVSIDGFAGALSSEASFDRMTIADDDGIWLTLDDVVLDWNRSALLRGRLEVEQLTAGRLDVERLPASNEVDLPDAEAKPFSLPDLPVSIEIADFSVDEINLGEPILGEAAQLSVSANARLTDTVGIVDFQARRTDGKRGEFDIQADFDRTENVLDLLLNLTEDPEGIASKLLNLPGQPSVQMTVEGAGPLDDFATDVTIATDGQERLAGQVTLGTQAPRRASDTPDRRIQADIGGDITALLAPRYRDFFGEDVRLALDALLESNGAVEVSSFALAANSVDLQGQVTLNQEKWPTLIDISGRIANPDGTSTLLPISGEGTRVEAVTLRVDYDAADGDRFDSAFDITGLDTGALQIAQTQLALDGILEGNLGSLGQFLGDVTFATEGLTLTDPASAEAIGDAITGSAEIRFVEGEPIEINGLTLSGEDYGLTGEAAIDGVDTGLLTQLKMTLEAQDISRFSALAGRDIAGATALALNGTVTPLGGMFDLAFAGGTDDLEIGIEQADAVLAGRTSLSMVAKRNETGTFLRDLELKNDALDLTGDVELRSEGSRAALDFTLADVGLVLPQYEGPIAVKATAVQEPRGWVVDAVTDGPYDAALTVSGLATGEDAQIDFTADIPRIEDFLPEADITGPVTAKGALRQTPQGWEIDTEASGPLEAQASVEGLVTPRVDVAFDLSLPDIQSLVPQINGGVAASGTLEQTEQGVVVDTIANGPYDSRVAVEGLATGPDMALRFDLTLPDVSPLAPGVNGPLAAQGTVRQQESGIAVDVAASGPYGSSAVVEGLATGPNMALSFDLSVPDVSPLAPGVNGPLSATGDIRQTDDGIAVDVSADGPYGSSAMVEGLVTGEVSLRFDVSVPNVNPLVPSVSGSFAANGVARQTENGVVLDASASGPYGARATVEGLVTGPNAAVDFQLNMPDIGALVEQVNGPLSVAGSARREGEAWRIDTSANGPAGTQATVAGLVNPDGTLNLDIAGNAPLGLSRPFLAPRNLQGQARFDLQINGPAALSSVSGRITTSGATFTAPNLRVALRGIDADVQLGGNRAQLNVTGQAVDGGELRVAGAITLTPALPADISVTLRNLVYADPSLYSTTLNGDLRLAGPLSGGAQITGVINAGETNIQVPATGLTSIGDIPQITQVNAPADVLATRRKAGLEGADAGDDPTEDASGPGFGLDLQLNAPNRIYVRGRGLDAELGGALNLSGTTNRIISAGRFELIRGRLDILGKRFLLDEGSIQFQGDFIPYIRFVTSTDTEAGEVRVIVSGPANEPEVTFESTPAAPQDEVLSQLLFGRNISEISAFQALQLASAVATLAGRGGDGVIGNLREGFGLDDLDVTTTEDGETALRLGKYLTDNIYTDVTAASDGTGEVSLNLDITESLTAKGTLGSDGDSSIGIFFERDY